MAQHKNALIRYKTIDKCLQNRYREWTLNDLIEACSDALYDLENRTVNISKRTIQLDIQNMRSEKLGYHAPIVVYKKKFYKYDDPNYSITQLPVSKNDMAVLTESVNMLKQFKDFSLFSDLGDIVTRIENAIHSEQNNQQSIIHMDQNSQLKGLEHLDTLYHATLKKMVLNINYQSFKARQPSSVIFHPYLLKEYNNRWFLVGLRQKDQRILNLALDRMLDINYVTNIPYLDTNFNPNTYYKHTIGVTMMSKNELQKLVFKIDAKNSPYVITKPFHHSQKIIRVCEDKSTIFEIYVHLNFELERLVLGFGNYIEIISPTYFKKRIKLRLSRAYNSYNS